MLHCAGIETVLFLMPRTWETCCSEGMPPSFQPLGSSNIWLCELCSLPRSLHHNKLNTLFSHIRTPRCHFNPLIWSGVQLVVNPGMWHCSMIWYLLSSCSHSIFFYECLYFYPSPNLSLSLVNIFFRMKLARLLKVLPSSLCCTIN